MFFVRSVLKKLDRELQFEVHRRGVGVIFLVLSFMCASFLFGCRTLSSLFAENKIQFRGKLVIEVVFFLSWLIVGVMFASKSLTALVLSLFWVSFFLILQKICQWKRDRSFRAEIEAFIDRSILHILGGKSFRASCAEAVKSCEAFTQQELNLMFSHVFFKQHLDQKLRVSFGNFLHRELQSMDEHAHSALVRLRGLRRNLALESEFRQKSEQIKGRVLIQSVFMMGLYLAVLIFILRQQSAIDFPSLLLSVTFFVTGFAWTLIDGRRIKWKT